jgi:hypothetical protein
MKHKTAFMMSISHKLTFSSVLIKSNTIDYIIMIAYWISNVYFGVVSKSSVAELTVKAPVVAKANGVPVVINVNATRLLSSDVAVIVITLCPTAAFSATLADPVPLAGVVHVIVASWEIKRQCFTLLNYL